jgi:putative transposase
MKLVVNTLVEWSNGDIERILWLSRRDVAVIEMNNDRAMPKICSRRMYSNALKQTKLRILESDPYTPLSSPDDMLTEAVRQRRDRAWTAIRPLVEDKIPTIFIRQQRSQLVTTRTAEVGLSKTTLYGYLRRYWQGSQTPNALQPGYRNSGGPGKDKSVSERKRGRPKSHHSESGINVNEEIRQRFRKGIQRFYASGEVRTLRDAYQRTLEHYFNCGYETQDGVPVPVLPPAHQLPTLRQFTYWYNKEQNLTRTLIRRRGQNRFNTEHRPLLGDSTGMAFGPGSIYQIDATVGDVYLVSALDPQRIIGRPVIYLVVDVFSRMLVGLAVTLEGPSWLGAMLALENTSADKVVFCEQHEITITSEEWPCQHLPEMLLADRGELEGYHGDNLTHALNVVVSNTAPYRADMKGIVEQFFCMSNNRVIADLPGAVREQERGAPDYRLDARLTLRQLTTLLIRSALYHNRHHFITDYPLDKQMLADGLEPYPLELWRWGIQNRTGHLRILPPDVVRLSLLPQSEAAITRKGIIFQGLQYTCELAANEGWYVKAGQSGRWKVTVSYDPRLTDWLYLWHDGGRQVEICSLVKNTHMTLFRGMDWDTVDAYFAQRYAQTQASRSRQQQGRAVLNAHKDHVIQQAREAFPDTKTSSRAAQVRGIHRNRQAERVRLRHDGAWRLVNDTSPKTTTSDNENGYIPPAQYLDLLHSEEDKDDNS